MKPVINSPNNQLRKCERTSSVWRSLLSWAPWPSPAMKAERTSSNENRISSNSKSTKKIWSVISSSLKTAPVVLVDAALRLRTRLQNLSNGKELVKTFPRLVVGFVCFAVLAPYADVFYTRLDFNARVSADVWYYESYHWLFLCIGPYLKSVFQAIGLYLVFARGSSILSLFAAYALMYDIGKILWLLQVANHDEYKSLPTNWFYAYGFLSGIFLILIVDKLIYWLNHRVEAIKRRLRGLRNIVDKTDPQMIVNGFVRTMDDDLMISQFKQP